MMIVGWAGIGGRWVGGVDGGGGVGNFMLAVNPLCNVNIDDSFPLSHETNLHRFHALSVF